MTYLWVIEKSSFINKAILEWRWRPQADQTVALFWPFIKVAHKKQRLKLEQENDEQASSVMLQKQYNDMALKVSQFKRFTDQQNTIINDVVDKVNDEASRSNRSIPGMINTAGTPSTSNSSALFTAQALIVSLTASLADAEKRQYVPRRDRNRSESGHFVDGQGRGWGRGKERGDQRPRGVLGPINETVDQQLTQYEDPNQTKKKCKNKLSVTLMDTNVLTDMTVLIVCTPKKDTNPVPLRKI